ncbi:MAG TPA: ester cyclase [Gemmatimonadota bacterium]|nr:ester cyclase [Gemmatimonadota bacterium]
MAPDDAGRIARRFLQVWTPGNLDLLEQLADPDIVVDYAHFGEPVRGVDAFRRTLEESFRDFPDLVTTAHTVVAAGDRAAVEWTYEGTHRDGELFGVEPVGTRVRVRGASFYRIRDGRVVEERGVADILGLMVQLGALGGG